MDRQLQRRGHRPGRRPGRRPTACGRLVAVAATLTGVLLVPAAPASASCATDDLARLAPQAEVALVGTVTSVDGGQARLRVSDVWRGSPGAVVDVDGGDPAVSTSVDWQGSGQYVVLARGSAEGLSTDVCAGTRPVDDAALAALDSSLGPATPLGRGAGTTSEDPATTPTPSATPSATPTRDAAGGADPEPAAAADGGGGLSTSELVAGILLGLALLASFLLPQLRRHNRERRGERRASVDLAVEPPEPDDPADSWR